MGKSPAKKTYMKPLTKAVFPKYKEKAIISVMKNTHPYEEVAYQIYMAL